MIDHWLILWVSAWTPKGVVAASILLGAAAYRWLPRLLVGDSPR